MRTEGEIVVGLLQRLTAVIGAARLHMTAHPEAYQVGMGYQIRTVFEEEERRMMLDPLGIAEAKAETPREAILWAVEGEPDPRGEGSP